MRTQQFLFGLVLATTFEANTSADDPKPQPVPQGVMVDLRGPPEGGNFKIDYLIKLEGEDKFTRHPVSHGGYSSKAGVGQIIFWKNDGFVVEKVGETQVRFVGYKDKNGRVIRVVDIKFESKDLRPGELPTVVPDPKHKV